MTTEFFLLPALVAEMRWAEIESFLMRFWPRAEVWLSPAPKAGDEQWGGRICSTTRAHDDCLATPKPPSSIAHPRAAFSRKREKNAVISFAETLGSAPSPACERRWGRATNPDEGHLATPEIDEEAGAIDGHVINAGAARIFEGEALAALSPAPPSTLHIEPSALRPLARLIGAN